ncbi:MAG: hypothetical protein M3440_09335 [Chloroflexota bacterium]|nr:hypothetical protein [Chloroflexota bacterium]
MSKRFVAYVAVLAAAFVLMAGYFVSAGTTSAQGADATPAGESEPHPAHIHSGTCAELGDVVFPLDDLTETGMTASPEPADETGSTPAASAEGGMLEGGSVEVVAESTTTVDVPLSDIISGEHAINVHESAENIQNYIACGDITGAETGGLQIELAELNDSGFEGIATLTNNGDDTTTVTVLLTRIDSGTPVATPAV